MCRMRMGKLTFITSYSSFIPSYSCFNILNKLYVLFQRVGTSLLSSASCMKHVITCVWIRILSCCTVYVHTFWSVSAWSRHVDINAHWVCINKMSSCSGTLCYGLFRYIVLSLLDQTYPGHIFNYSWIICTTGPFILPVYLHTRMYKHLLDLSVI